MANKCIILCIYSTIVSMYIATYLTARNKNKFKFWQQFVRERKKSLRTIMQRFAC
jgi:hypothetical protein